MCRQEFPPDGIKKVEMTKDVSKKEDEVTIKHAQPSDMAALFEWRNHPDVRRNSFNSSPLAPHEHEEWFKRKLKDPNCYIYMACIGDDKVGSIRFEDIGEAIKTSVLLNPAYCGRGLGSKVITVGTEMFIHDRQTVKPIVAEIKSSNKPSIKAFEKAGFKEEFATYIFEEKIKDA